ncbi:MAG: hypothetical protein ACRD16_11695, partial [Thermoanaerobaculia bacterium]
TRTEFQPTIDLEFPSFSPFRENERQFQRNVGRLHGSVIKAFDGLIHSANPSRRTDILDSLNVAQQVFSSDKREKVLILFSDMIEDSDPYNFERERIDTRRIDKIIQERRKSGEVPDLSGVRIFVVGADARTERKAEEIEKFWTQYFRESKATFDPANYAHSLIGYSR